MIRGQPIEHILILIWAFSLSTLAIGLFLAGLLLAGRNSTYLRGPRGLAVGSLSIAMNTGAIVISVLLALTPHTIRFTYQPRLIADTKWQPSADARFSVLTTNWGSGHPPRTAPIVLDFFGRVLNRLSRYPRWNRLFERVRTHAPIQPGYHISYQLRLQTDRFGGWLNLGASMKGWRGPEFGKPAPRKIDLATVSLTSTLAAQGQVHVWPVQEFRIDCVDDKSSVSVRPMSRWIADENLKEHETFTLPDGCIRQESILVDIYLSPDENSVDLARLTITTVEVKELEEEHTPSLSAYVGMASFRPGDTLPIKINASGAVDIEIIRLGLENRVVHSVKNIPVSPQKANSMLSFQGVNWDTAYRHVIPNDWHPGYYLAKITRKNEEFFTYFLVSHSKDETPPAIAILVPTNTWQAYNPWGGGGFYSLNLMPFALERQAHRVGMQRPLLLGAPDARHEGSHLVQAELEIAKWLEKKGYKYTVYTDSDLHAQPDLILKNRLAIIPSHSEYWSDEMVRALGHFLDNGGSLAYLGGNAIYQRVTIKDGVMEGYNHRQFHQQDGSLGGFFYLLNRPQSAILGVQYNSVGYNSFVPYVVKADDHWALNATGLRNGDKFGSGVQGKTQYFAAGHETDKATNFSPKNLTLLAEGAIKSGGAMMTIYDHPGGGVVYAVGSISYANTLNLDSKQGKILRNVITRVLDSN